LTTEPSTLVRWPGVRVVLGCSLATGIAVAIDTYFSAQAGYLARPPDYEGIGYVQFARTAYLLLRQFHLKAALQEMNSIAPLWTVLQTLQYFIVGDGTWQAFTVRFWPVALLVILVYWIVRNRATRGMAVAAAALTALLPMASASVRSSSWEFFSQRANYAEDWRLDDLRPDFLAAVLILWSIASVAEHNRAPRRSAYIVSAVFAASAVLTKPSTATFGLVAWAMALGLLWLWRRDAATVRLTALAVGLLVILLIPWGIVGGGFVATVARLYEAAFTYGAAYSAGVQFPERLIYYLVRIPNQVGQVEAPFVIVGSLFLAVLMLRRRLDRAEVVYAALIAFFYLAFTLPANKDPNIGEYVSLSVWIFFLAGASRLLVARWPEKVMRASPALLAGVSVYVLLVYSLGLVGLANWPDSERRANAQQLAVTADVAQELSRHISVFDCFTYAPGPGWPASIEYSLQDSNARAPFNSPIDVDPKTTTINDYVGTARFCRAVLVYRENIAQVAQVYFVPPVRQPYLQALSDWVRSPSSGYIFDKSWRLYDLPPLTPHTLGRYQGVNLTVDLYIRA
jgi:hypothetical protein